jgi:hypothetical protein
VASKLAKPSELANLKVQIGMVKSENANPLYSRVFDIAAFRRKANVWVNNSQKLP